MITYLLVGSIVLYALGRKAESDTKSSKRSSRNLGNDIRIGGSDFLNFIFDKMQEAQNARRTATGAAIHRDFLLSTVTMASSLNMKAVEVADVFNDLVSSYKPTEDDLKLKITSSFIFFDAWSTKPFRVTPVIVGYEQDPGTHDFATAQGTNDVSNFIDTAIAGCYNWNKIGKTLSSEFSERFDSSNNPIYTLRGALDISKEVNVQVFQNLKAGALEVNQIYQEVYLIVDCVANSQSVFIHHQQAQQHFHTSNPIRI
jgi:hypothetical protein